MANAQSKYSTSKEADPTEKAVLQRMVALALVTIVLYAVHDSLYLNLASDRLNFVITALVFVLYLACFFWVGWTKHFEITKTYVFSFLTVSLMAGFFVHQGFRGIIAMDLTNAFILLSILFKGKRWRIFISIYFAIVGIITYVEFFLPSWIINTRSKDALWLDILEVLLRVVMAFSLGKTIKNEYDKEKATLTALNLALQESNEEIRTQSEMVERSRAEVMEINTQLNAIVAERTQRLEQLNGKLAEYAYFNAHNVRGPLARILGVVQVAKLFKDKSKLHTQDLTEYMDRIALAATELDERVHEINFLLEEREKVLKGTLTFKDREK